MNQDLDKELREALQQDKYDLQLFLRFLKSYVVSGSQPEKQLLLGILLQALPRFHTSDFSACISLISSHVQDASYIEKDIILIYDLENYLSSGNFPQFWQVWRESEGTLPARPSFEPNMRAAILTVIGCTLGHIQTKDLSVYLGLKSGEKLEEVLREAARIAGDAVQLVGADEQAVVFQKSVFNAPESDSNQELKRFSDTVTIVSL
ncbi:COP9 signalosome, subunit CSN8, putative [Trypanosoma equiperdum]|uniref:CSN8/PSMD8/EIF3K domain-containing protein n=2 Tax=Trypanozoon TaxID=39700 RepID=Q381P3_TRYB2|nr:hypothetical protein, conserved [Trypanosoma brucei brucei TREU927]EAN80488.1 hypothetical protein, conserved [Trypanosoma brucei brucei TREU927]SCU73216.1 COP9 signalosome, subunit CSN8, putative [Trypanosoma equiperdum]